MIKTSFRLAVSVCQHRGGFFFVYVEILDEVISPLDEAFILHLFEHSDCTCPILFDCFKLPNAFAVFRYHALDDLGVGFHGVKRRFYPAKLLKLCGSFLLGFHQ